MPWDFSNGRRVAERGSRSSAGSARGTTNTARISYSCVELKMRWPWGTQPLPLATSSQVEFGRRNRMVLESHKELWKMPETAYPDLELQKQYWNFWNSSYGG